VGMCDLYEHVITWVWTRGSWSVSGGWVAHQCLHGSLKVALGVGLGEVQEVVGEVVVEPRVDHLATRKSVLHQAATLCVQAGSRGHRNSHHMNHATSGS